MTDWLIPKNNASSFLAAAIDAEAPGLSVRSGEGSRFPSTFPFRISIDDEILEVTNRSGDTMTVNRAQEGTSAASHGSNVAVRLNITAGIITQLQQEIDAINTPLYIPKSFVDAKGDILCGSADNTPARLPVGSNGQLLQADSTQDIGIKWANVSSLLLATGTYTGDGTTNRAIPHGLGNTPKLVLIQKFQASGLTAQTFIQIPDKAYTLEIKADDFPCTIMDVTNFYATGEANESSYSYRWYAIA